mgnify:CR=1 FL=1
MQRHFLPIFLIYNNFLLFRALLVHYDVAVAVVRVERQIMLLVRRVVGINILLLNLTHRPFDAINKLDVVRQL